MTVLFLLALFAQQQQNGDTLQLQAQTPQASAATGKSGRSAAPFDIAGNWVAVINEDWRWRMLTPDKGDFSSVPLNMEGRRAADRWQPAKQDLPEEQCKVYGAPALMRLPTRLRISWADDNTLKIETDFGMQTRLLHFGETPPGALSLQGTSLAAWESDAHAANALAPSGPRDLKITTSNLLPGYLRRNGIPYSENAALTEYVDLFPKQPNGDEWLVVTTIVNDPLYLTERFITSSNFKREPDGSKWHPAPCGRAR